MNHETVRAAKAPAKPVKARIILQIRDLVPVIGEDNLFSLEVDSLPAQLNAEPIIETLKEQGIEPRVADEAIEAVFEVLHRDMVAKMLGKRVRYCGPA